MSNMKKLNVILCLLAAACMYWATSAGAAGGLNVSATATGLNSGVNQVAWNASWSLDSGDTACSAVASDYNQDSHGLSAGDTSASGSVLAGDGTSITVTVNYVPAGTPVPPGVSVICNLPQQSLSTTIATPTYSAPVQAPAPTTQAPLPLAPSPATPTTTPTCDLTCLQAEIDDLQAQINRAVAAQAKLIAILTTMPGLDPGILAALMSLQN
jgi:hypothetical protein